MKVFLILMAVSVIVALMNADIKKKEYAEQEADDKEKLNNRKYHHKQSKRKDKSSSFDQNEMNSAYNRYLTKKDSTKNVRLNRNY